ncbi:hypothetical protein [Paenibacillus sp. GP183]|uniref:hypothetical protein n=1 Tax=Paenibacillus sp. GP183 TaxID=1882751 RepID=UPI00089D833D|nr:hypothetical protein [Paenibacillus sp. GP183]SEB92424.1 hypothetical protein SAMN05443246_2376 [Paenibacillus sp. GP183]
MRLKKPLFIALTGFIALLIAFIYLTPFAGNLVVNTRFEGYARSVDIKIIKKSPPLPSVTSGQTQIPVIQSSYCWDYLGCVDYVRGKTMLKGIPPTVVTPEADIKVSFAYKPAPNELKEQQFVDDKTIQIPLNDGFFNAPKEKGIYYYGISAFWKTDDGKFSKGDTSSVFVIEVR